MAINKNKSKVIVRSQRHHHKISLKCSRKCNRKTIKLKWWIQLTPIRSVTNSYQYLRSSKNFLRYQIYNHNQISSNPIGWQPRLSRIFILNRILARTSLIRRINKFRNIYIEVTITKKMIKLVIFYPKAAKTVVDSLNYIHTGQLITTMMKYSLRDPGKNTKIKFLAGARI